MDFSALADAADTAVAFPAPFKEPVLALFVVGEGDASAAADGPDSSATERDCPTAAMAFTLSLGNVWVEPME